MHMMISSSLRVFAIDFLDMEALNVGTYIIDIVYITFNEIPLGRELEKGVSIKHTYKHKLLAFAGNRSIQLKLLAEHISSVRRTFELGL